MLNNRRQQRHRSAAGAFWAHHGPHTFGRRGPGASECRGAGTGTCRGLGAVTCCPGISRRSCSSALAASGRVATPQHTSSPPKQTSCAMHRTTYMWWVGAGCVWGQAGTGGWVEPGHDCRLPGYLSIASAVWVCLDLLQAACTGPKTHTVHTGRPHSRPCCPLAVLSGRHLHAASSIPVSAVAVRLMQSTSSTTIIQLERLIFASNSNNDGFDRHRRASYALLSNFELLL